MQKRLIIGISGATGVIYGIRLLEVLKPVPEVETHLILTNPGKQTLLYETDYSVKDVESLADFVYSDKDISATISSGSFRTHGMIIAPCSINSLAGIANCDTNRLLTRAADVCLKERRKLILLLRETPLHIGHIRLMKHVTAAGGIIMPPVPAFYIRPKSLDDIINQTIGRALDQLDLGDNITDGLFKRWEGTH
jgi:4-hydroxy-3-polyprenylbenzoate decarboxylase